MTKTMLSLMLAPAVLSVAILAQGASAEAATPVATGTPAGAASGTATPAAAVPTPSPVAAGSMSVRATLPLPPGTTVAIDSLGRDGSALPCVTVSTAPAGKASESTFLVEIPESCAGPYRLLRVVIQGAAARSIPRPPWAPPGPADEFVVTVFDFRPGTSLDLGLVSLVPPTPQPPLAGGGSEVRTLPSTGAPQTGRRDVRWLYGAYALFAAAGLTVVSVAVKTVRDRVRRGDP